MTEWAAGPVPIQAAIQPFGCLIGVDAETRKILYASENCAQIIGQSSSDLLGAALEGCFDGEFVHALANAEAVPRFFKASTTVGSFKLNGSFLAVSAFDADGVTVAHFEPEREGGQFQGQDLSILTFLSQKILTCMDQASLLKVATDLLQHVTGYDRVMICENDEPHACRILEEACNRSVPTLRGAHIPHREMFKDERGITPNTPMSIVQNLENALVPLLAAHASLPTLDISLADCRGDTTIDLEFLRTLGVKSAMSLPIIVDAAHWGTVAFHHRHERIPAPTLRAVLTAFVGLFSEKLSALQKQEQLDGLRKVDCIMDLTLAEQSDSGSMEELIPRVAPLILEVLKADGVAWVQGTQTSSFGLVPDQDLLTRLVTEARDDPKHQFQTNTLATAFPTLTSTLNGCAGALVCLNTANSALCIFREETHRSVYLAEETEHTEGLVTSDTHLGKDAAFPKFLKKLEGVSDQWTKNEAYVADRIFVLLENAERKALMNSLLRQDTASFKAMKHRVRNILDMVRSVSRRIDPDGELLAERIRALFAVHDIVPDANTQAVNIADLIEAVVAPFQKNEAITVSPTQSALNVAVAPIFSLVVHELVRNAVAYGALCKSGGHVAIDIETTSAGAAVTWRESGGPKVAIPEAYGFGASFIEQAIPQDMGGTAELRFDASGVQANFCLPSDQLEADATGSRHMRPDASEPLQVSPDTGFEKNAVGRHILVLEDNFVIATDIKDQLENSGNNEVTMCRTVDDGLDVLAARRPEFAILDVDLGQGTSSEHLALKLLQLDVPFIFVTGYDDGEELSHQLRHVPCLTKPVANTELQNVMMAMLAP